MKRTALYFIFAIATLIASASTEWTLQGKPYTVDTLNHINVGPSTTLTSLRLTGTQNLNVFYTTTDLTNPLIEMEVLKAKDIIYARQEVSGMALDHDSDSKQYFLGVNADFFNMRRGNSIGSQITDGELVYVDNSERTQWAIGDDRLPIMDCLHISCTAIAGDKVANISGVNKVATANSLNIFTPRYGASTDTTKNTYEVAIVPVDAPISVGKKVKMKVTSAPATGGNMAIPANGYILSGTGTDNSFVKSLSQGDIIEITTTISTSKGQNITPTEVVSGYPVILSNGKVTNPVDILRHLNGLHPRTVVGNDKTGTKLVILIVDGRSNDSEGCTSKVLADIMSYAGCDDAMNLDGGGSSELYVRSLGICNVPSDGKERTVANGLFAIAKAPVDNEIASIAFAEFRKTIDGKDTYTPVIYGYNKYGIIVDKDVKGVKLSCPRQLGKIAQKGTTLQPTGNKGTHTLTARFGKLTASMPIIVK